MQEVGNNIEGEAEWDKLGNSAAMSSDGKRVIIGASANYGNPPCSGHARILYEDINGTWVQVGNDIDGEGSVDKLGESADMRSDGKRVVILAPPKRYGSGSSSGHARIYEEVNGTWVQVGNDIEGEAEGDYFGQSVAISSNGKRVIIGAPQNDGGFYGISKVGYARVFLFERNSTIPSVSPSSSLSPSSSPSLSPSSSPSLLPFSSASSSSASSQPTFVIGIMTAGLTANFLYRE